MICLQNDDEEVQSVVSIDNLEFCTDVSVRTEEITNSIGCTIFPNPTTDKLNIAFQQPLNNSLKLAVLNLTGQMIITENIGAGNSNISVSTADLPPGLYFIQLRSDGNSISIHKVVKQ